MKKRKEKTPIGVKLRNLRNKAGVSSTDLSKELGIAASYVCLLEAGTRPITKEMVSRYVNALNKIVTQRFQAVQESRLYGRYSTDWLL